MRLLERTTILLSEDLGPEPKKIRFKEQFENSELELIKEVKVLQEVFPIGTHSISLGNIAQGRFLLIKPKSNVQISINGGAALTLREDKVTKMWLNFTQLSLTVTGSASEVIIVVAGQ
jgi:hypothetical protein